MHSGTTIALDAWLFGGDRQTAAPSMQNARTTPDTEFGVLLEQITKMPLVEVGGGMRSGRRPPAGIEA
jgi:hypothetical protein